MNYYLWIKLQQTNFGSMLAIIVFALTLSPVAEAEQHEELPKLELGIGLVQFSMPEYRGSSARNIQLLPFPYVKYRGKKLKVDDGVEGRLFNTPDLLLAISGNGSLPSSNKDSERSGMKSLDATLELGPSLELRLQSNDDSSLWLELPLRFAFALGHKIEPIGNTFHPRLAWRWPAKDKYDWKLRIAGGPLYANTDYHSYFYDVDSSEVTAQRPEYSAGSGYSGVRLDFTFSRRIQKWWLGGFVRYDDLNGSEIEDSPLVTDTSNWTVGLSLAFVISER
jgi:MipA family protein